MAIPTVSEEFEKRKAQRLARDQRRWKSRFFDRWIPVRIVIGALIIYFGWKFMHQSGNPVCFFTALPTAMFLLKPKNWLCKAFGVIAILLFVGTFLYYKA